MPITRACGATASRWSVERYQCGVSSSCSSSSLGALASTAARRQVQLLQASVRPRVEAHNRAVHAASRHPGSGWRAGAGVMARSLSSQAIHGVEGDSSATGVGAGDGGSGNGGTGAGGTGDDSGVEDQPLHAEAKQSFMSYAIAVIADRALPDARDGLKPVQRRLLFGMRELGLSSSKQHRKSARIVGDVLGKLHPHGDVSLYNTLVGMQQPFTMRVPFVDGQGNFGNLDDDPPAAMRYTEVRLASVAEKMLLANLDEGTVPFKDTFDGQLQEPTVLPAVLPNLLLNGGVGIAVGMATKIAPHNLREVADASIAFARNPSMTTLELMEHLKGPDFPTGGAITDKSGQLGEIYKMYETGRATITCRGNVEKEFKGEHVSSIVVSSLPYHVGKTNFLDGLIDRVDDGQIKGIADIRDETDRRGMRIVLEMKKRKNDRVDPDHIIRQLYHLTKLENTSRIHMIALKNGSPRTMSLRDIMANWLEFRRTVVQRRAEHRRRRAEKRLHTVEGYLLAVGHMEELAKGIMKSDGPEMAKSFVMDLIGATEEQAQSILSMQLRRLSKLEQSQAEREAAELRTEIASLTQMLESPDQITGAIVADIEAIAREFGTDRRTRIELFGGAGELDVTGRAPADTKFLDMMMRSGPNEPCVVLLTKRGYLKRVPESKFQANNRMAKGKSAKLPDSDSIRLLERCNSHDSMLIFLNEGRTYCFDVGKIPDSGVDSKGVLLKTMVAANRFQSDADSGGVTEMLAISNEELNSDSCLLFCTQDGFVKKVKRSMFKNSSMTQGRTCHMHDGDKLVLVEKIEDDDTFVVVSRKGQVLHCAHDDVRSMSLKAIGVKTMQLNEGDGVAGAAVVPDGKRVKNLRTGVHNADPSKSEVKRYLLLCSKKGLIKRVDMNDVRVMGRLTKGLRGWTNLREGDELLAPLVLDEQEEDIFVATKRGMVKRLKGSTIPLWKRDSGGLSMIQLAEGDSIRSIARARGDEEEEDDCERAANGAQL